jgi:hypothetical protein
VENQNPLFLSELRSVAAELADLNCSGFKHKIGGITKNNEKEKVKYYLSDSQTNHESHPE